jgi:hypothetical protein
MTGVLTEPNAVHVGMGVDEATLVMETELTPRETLMPPGLAATRRFSVTRIRQRWQETPREARKRVQWLGGHLLNLLLLIVYLIIGYAVYSTLEQHADCQSEQLEDEEATTDGSGTGPSSPPSQPQCPWGALDATYFAVVTMSTVGYGDLSPTSFGSQLFTIFYAMAGIVVIFSRMSGQADGI